MKFNKKIVSIVLATTLVTGTILYANDMTEMEQTEVIEQVEVVEQTEVTEEYDMEYVGTYYGTNVLERTISGPDYNAPFSVPAGQPYVKIFVDNTSAYPITCTVSGPSGPQEGYMVIPAHSNKAIYLNSGTTGAASASGATPQTPGKYTVNLHCQNSNNMSGTLSVRIATLPSELDS